MSRSESAIKGEIRYGLRPSLLSPLLAFQFKNHRDKGTSKPATEYTYPQLPIQKAATRPGSIFNRQGGSTFNRRRQFGVSVDENGVRKAIALFVQAKSGRAYNIETPDQALANIVHIEPQFAGTARFDQVQGQFVRAFMPPSAPVASKSATK